MKRPAALLAMLAGCMPLMFCSKPLDTADGAGVETENVITGVIKDPKDPAAGVIVTLYPENFNPVADRVPDSLRGITDRKGEYLFIAPEPGVYNIQAIRPEDRATALVRGIEVPGGDGDTVITAPEAKLKTPGKVTIYLEELAVEESGHVYIPGTGINADITVQDINNRYLSIDNFPPAAYPAVHYAAPDLSFKTILLDEEVNVRPGETAVIGPFHAWSDTAKIIIDTSPSGADVARDVTDFPLLVRLTGPIVTLSPEPDEGSKGDGDDLRFTKSDGTTPLPYQIERWDPAKGLAEIWVGMDTVYGDNEAQFIYIYTGKSGAPAQSSGPGVFDIQNNFAGVWHLGEKGNTEPDGYLDATGNENHVTGSGVSAGSGLEGVIGGGQTFDGVNDFLAGPCPAELNGNTDLTASFWMKFRIDSDSARYWVIDFGQMGPPPKLFHFLVWHDTVAQFGLRDYKNPLLSDKQNYFSLAGYYDSWVLVTSTYDGLSNELSSYLNGRLVDRDTIPIIALEPSGGLRIGQRRINTGEGYYDAQYLGALDEIRLSAVTRSEAWILLSYENQKESSKLVRIE